MRPSLADPARYADVNVLGTVRVTEAARAHGVRRLVFASSSSVYGLDSEPPFKESDPCLKPLSPYASTKRAGELGLFAAHHLYDLDVTCLRFFTVYGPRQRPDLAIHKFARLILAGQPIELFGDGSTSRDYTWIDDIIDGVVASIDEASGRAPAFRIYNLGGSRTTTLLGLVELLGRARQEARHRMAARAARGHEAHARGRVLRRTRARLRAARPHRRGDRPLRGLGQSDLVTARSAHGLRTRARREARAERPSSSPPGARR